jgi:hypothetical protein
VNKIASPQELASELRRLLAYCQEGSPRREVLSSELRLLANRVAASHLLDAPLDRPARIMTDGVGSKPDFDNEWYSVQKGDVPTKILEGLLEHRHGYGHVTLQLKRVESPTKAVFTVKTDGKGDGYLIEVELAESNGRKWKT